MIVPTTMVRYQKLRYGGGRAPHPERRVLINCPHQSRGGDKARVLFSRLMGDRRRLPRRYQGTLVLTEPLAAFRLSGDVISDL